MEAFPLLPFQRGATGAEVPFHHCCRRRQSFEGTKDFFQNIPKFPEKVFVQLLPTKIMKTLFGVNSKKIFVFFCKPWAPFLPGFSEICPDFQQIKTFWGELGPTASPPPVQLLFKTLSQVISQFIKVAFKQSYCNHSGTQKIQNHFL